MPPPPPVPGSTSSVSGDAHLRRSIPETSLQDNLSAIVQDLQSTSSKDKKKCMDTLNQFLTEVVERGVCPMEALGQHVCCNLMGLTIEHFVTPQLMKRTNNSSTARTDITKPFAQLLEHIHHHIPSSFKQQPLLYKQGKPLHTLVKHIAEVLEGATTGLVCGHDYSVIIQMLLNVEGYRNSITRRAVLELMTRLMDLIQSAIDERRSVVSGGAVSAASRGVALSEAALEQIATALAALADCPHLASNMQDPSDRVKRMISIALSLHENVAVSSSLKVEMQLVTAIRRSVAASQYDFRTSCASQRIKLLRALLSAWHLASRRDGWKLETVQFATLQLSLVFSDLIHHMNHNEVDQRVSSSERAVTFEATMFDGDVCPASLVSAVEELHVVILPAVLSILSATKCEFSIVNSRELSHAPCSPLQTLFDFASLVLGLAHRTYRWFRPQVTPVPEGGGGGHDEDGRPAQKKRRSDGAPLDDVLAHLKSLSSDPSAATFRRDVCCVWLHTLACPFASVCLTEADVTRLVEGLIPFGQLGACVEQPLLAALSVTAPRAALENQHRLFQWAVTKYIPCTGVDVDDGTPLPLAYDLMSRLLSYAIAKKILQQQQHRKDEDQAVAAGAAPWFEPYLLTAVQCRSYHVSHALATNPQLDGWISVVRFRVRMAQVALIAAHLDTSTTTSKHDDLPAPLHYTSVLRFVVTLMAHLRTSSSQALDASSALMHDITSMNELRILSRLRSQGSGSILSEERMQHCIRGTLERLQRERRDWTGFMPFAVTEACLPDGLLSSDPFSGGLVSASAPTAKNFVGLDDIATRDTVRLLSVAALDAASSIAQRDAANSIKPQTRINIPQTDTAKRSFASVRGVPSLVTCCFQIVEVLLQLRSYGYWACPEGDVDGSKIANLPRLHHGGDTASVLQHITPASAILLSIQQLLEVAAANFAKSSALLSELRPEDIAAFHRMMQRCGADLFSVDVGMWEPSQRILSSLGLIGRKLLECVQAYGSACGASAATNHPSRLAGRTNSDGGVVANSVPFDEEGVRDQVLMLREVCDALRTFYIVTRTTDICLSATDPLISIQNAVSVIMPVLQAPSLQLIDSVGVVGAGVSGNLLATGGSAASQQHQHLRGGSAAASNASLMSLMKPPMGALIVLEVIEPLLSILIALASEEAHLTVMEVAKVLFERHPHSHIHDVLEILASLGDTTRCPGWTHAIRNVVGAFCHKVIATLREQDRDTGVVVASLPPLHLSVQVAMVRCIAQVLSRCEASQAERLAKLFFEFSGVNSTFALRLATARWIAVPFATFTRVGSVLQELQYNSQQTVLAKERATCATALLALCNASAAAPQLQPDVVSFMLEFYATRDFLHKPLILQAIQRLATEEKHRLLLVADWEGAEDANVPSPSTLADDEGSLPMAKKKIVPLFAQLTRQHALRLLYDWMWRLGHPLEAFPVICFGYDTLQALAGDAVGLMLPIALLHLQGSEANRVPSHNTSVSTIFGMFSPSGDTSGLLRQQFSETVSLLLLFREAKASAPCTRAHQDLAEAAAFALEWVAVQLGRELFQDLCRKNAEAIVILLLQRVGKGSGAGLMLQASGSIGHGSSSSSTIALPSLSFAVATKALAHLCSTLGYGSIRQFFQTYHGDRAYQMLWYMYFDYCAAPSPTSRCDILLVLEQVLSGWLPDTVLFPHVLEASLMILCNMLSSSHHRGGDDSAAAASSSSSGQASAIASIPSPGARQLICNVLKSVWVRLRGSAPHRDLLRPHAPLVSSTLLSLKHQFVEIGRLWTDLCAEDATLRQGDWAHQQVHFQQSLSQNQLRIDDEEAVEQQPKGNSDRASATPEACDAFLRVLEDIKVLSGTPTATFYNDLADALERQAHVFVMITQRDPLRASVASQVTAQHLLRVASHPGDLNLVDVRIAALGALRALYSALLVARKHLSTSSKDRIRPGTPAQLLLEPSLLLRSGQHDTTSFSVNQALLDGTPHDVILDEYYVQLFVHLRSLCQHHNPLLSIEAAAALRRLMTSTHELMSRAKKAAELKDLDRKGEGVSIKALLEPFHREGANSSNPSLLLLSRAYIWGANYGALSKVTAGFTTTSSSSGGDLQGGTLGREASALDESSKARLPAAQGGVLSDPSLWVLLPQHPQRFLCKFATSFIEHYQLHIKFDFVAALLPVVQLHFHTAAKMIPLLFLHALMLNENETQRRARRAWSELIRKHVFEQAAVVPFVARVFFKALDTARCAITSVIKTNGLRTKATKAHDQHAKVKTAAGMISTVDSVTELWWLSDITAVELAKAAEDCNLWDACVFYLELSCESLLKKSGGRSSLNSSGTLTAVVPRRQVDSNRPVTREAAKLAEAAATVEAHRTIIMNMCMHVGRALGDVDWLDGCSRNIVLNDDHNLVRLQAHGNWLDVLRQSDHHFLTETSTEQLPFMTQSLIHVGCPSTASAFIMSSTIKASSDGRRDTPAMRAALAEAAWRSAQWDTTEVVSRLLQGESTMTLHEAIFSALRACRSKDILSFRIALRSGKAAVLSSLLGGGFHAVKDAIALSDVFHQMTRFAEASHLLGGAVVPVPGGMHSGDGGGKLDVSEALTLDETLSFDRIDLFDSVRLAMCQLPSSTGVDYHKWSQWLVPAVNRALESGAVAAAGRKLDTFYLAVQRSAPESVKRIAALPSLVHCRAKLLVQQGEPSLAIRILQDVVEKAHKAAGKEGGHRAKLSPDIIRSMITWAHDAQLVPTTSLIREEGFHEIVSVQESGGRSSFAMAQLCDQVLSELQSRWDSAEAQRIRRSLADSTQLRNDLKVQLDEVIRRVEALKIAPASAKQQQDLVREQEVSKVLRMRIENIRKEMEHYTSQNAKIIQDWSVYRNTSIFHYAKALNELGIGAREGGGGGGTTQSGPSMTLGETQCLRVQAIFRIAALWLAPPASADVVASEQDASSISLIPTECFLPLYTQLAARASSATGTQQSKLLMDTLVKVATDFPYHTLWPLMALANGHRWSPLEQATHTTDTDKIEAARGVLSAMKKQSPTALAPIVKSVERLADAYLELAFEAVPPKQITIAIKPQLKLVRHVTEFQRLPVPTVTLPVDPTIAGRGYKLDSDVPTVFEFRAHYETAGGINLPKILSCVSSTGTVEKQLLKSNDDMRQDAIIEQFFGVVNTLLTAKRPHQQQQRGQSVVVRRYQVVPLAPSSGVLQWVPHTMPLGQYLIDARDGGEFGAHARYFPNDQSFGDCRAQLDSKALSKMEQRLPAYQSITTKFTPAMHYFFVEQFASAEVWLERKRAYSTSVACASVVGHLVGLGDRHLSNILLDKRTAEVVLIDLGIAFDQGKLLRLPETVPFRLTRDMVDGLGMHGVEGAFRNTCEATLKITREHRDLLSTVLDAFIHDPLAKWAVDTNNNGTVANQQQIGTNTIRPVKAKQSTADADRALARVREKLQGYEGGEVFSVQGQAQRLIQMATSEENLAAMYEGWAAWV
ncbi:phosphatidylinositol 3-kinase, putative [Bodo saltans]|uniref:non-specific serine/threonine protein kinase n=1 Tax=Bodo saltans TaxID=75058 RepID=A0A0S4J900_BODSA|nr:phosphatidylinositol 3-kinase, putative [Bodo saltans]|eukprot:CUG86712.1 phosphatidylinositol 3-kinase, putative [Bodo saltans]